MARLFSFYRGHRFSCPARRYKRRYDSSRTFGFASLQIAQEDLNRPGKVVQLGVKPNRIDLITSISGVSFDEAWKRRVAGFIDGIAVHIFALRI